MIIQDLNDGSGSTVVGYRQHLRAVVTTAGKTIAQHQWVVPGAIVADYQVDFPDRYSETSAVVTPVTELQSDEVSFVWVDGGEDRRVDYTVTFTDGTALTQGILFDVDRPVPEVTITPSSAPDSANPRCLTQTCLGTAVWMNQTYLIAQFGRDAPNPVAGMTFTLEDLGYSSGESQWVQVVHMQRNRSYPSGEILSQQGFGLDTEYPYSNSNVATDSPALYLEVPFANVPLVSTWNDDRFEMYLMFRPDAPSNSIWVPLRKVSWQWATQVHHNGGNQFFAASWDIFQSSHSTSEASDTTEFPEWERNAQSLEWNPL